MEPIVVSYSSVGIIHGPNKDAAATPIQAAGAAGIQGSIEIFPTYVEGLVDLEGFSHLILIYHLHRIKKSQLTVTPFLDTDAHGVFATRSPARPNPIGLSVVRLLSVHGNVLIIDDVDMFDETPLLDLKPFVPAFDHRSDVSVGWFSGKLDTLDGRTGDGRFTPGN
jgi:tRNA-Thr(GGU) m(6)t(6)A37 methyltransferase TsaA